MCRRFDPAPVHSLCSCFVRYFFSGRILGFRRVTWFVIYGVPQAFGGRFRVLANIESHCSIDAGMPH